MRAPGRRSSRFGLCSRCGHRLLGRLRCSPWCFRGWFCRRSSRRILIQEPHLVHIREFIRFAGAHEYWFGRGLLPCRGRLSRLRRFRSLVIHEAHLLEVRQGAGLDRLRALAGRIATADHWDRLALRTMEDDLYSAQRLMACEAIIAANGNLAAAVDQWRDMRREDIGGILNFIGDIERGGNASIAKLALANSQTQKLATSTAKR